MTRKAALQRFRRRVTAERRVEDALYRAASATFGHKGIVDKTVLAGCHQVVCSVLNALKCPLRPRRASRLRGNDDANHTPGAAYGRRRIPEALLPEILPFVPTARSWSRR